MHTTNLYNNKINTIQWFVFKKFFKGPENINISTRVVTKLSVLLGSALPPCCRMLVLFAITSCSTQGGGFHDKLRVNQFLSVDCAPRIAVHPLCINIPSHGLPVHNVYVMDECTTLEEHKLSQQITFCK
jgi:hypothetical protein